MEIIFQPQAIEDLAYWKTVGSLSVINKINQLLKNIQETPYQGLGKPEALKYGLSGQWSRRITEEHRLVYSVNGNKIIVYQLRFHY